MLRDYQHAAKTENWCSGRRGQCRQKPGSWRKIPADLGTAEQRGEGSREIPLSRCSRLNRAAIKASHPPRSQNAPSFENRAFRDVNKDADEVILEWGC